MKIDVKKYRQYQNISYKAELHIDDELAANISYNGKGGNIKLQFLNPQLEKRFDAYCRSLPPRKCVLMGIDYPMDTAVFMIELMTQTEVEFNIAKLCKTCTVFRLKSDERLAYRTWRHPFSEATKKTLLGHYGDEIDFFYNERL
jgi:hypothetical protein